MFPRLPLDSIGITNPFSKSHPAIDLGWSSYRGEPVYASLSGTVVLSGFFSDAGNTLVIATDTTDATIITRYLHLKDKPKYKIGDSVKQNEIIGNMGDTGNARGVHLHFEYWRCPKNYSYKFKDIYKYALNPLDYCYVLDGMKVSSDDKKLVKYLENNAETSNKSEIDILKEKIQKIKQIIEE